MNAYTIKVEYEMITDLLVTLENMKERGEDVTEFEADTQKYITQLKGSLYEKADNIGMVLRNLDIMINGRKEEAKRLTAAAKVLENRAEYIKNKLLLPMMTASGNRKLECKTFTVSLRKSIAVEITDTEKIPELYFHRKEVVSLDKVAVKACLKSGSVIAGAELVERESVQIK